jgi:type 1 fimbria pilin
MKTRRTIFATILLALTLGLATGFAHNGVEHVMGTVTAVTANAITVETVKHESVTVQIDATTKFANNGADGSLKDVKTGLRVVIDAKPNADKKLLGVTVKLGSSATAEHAEHSK